MLRRIFGVVADYDLIAERIVAMLEQDTVTWQKRVTSRRGLLLLHNSD